MTLSIRGASGAGNAPHQNITAGTNPAEAQQFSRVMSSNAPPAPSAPVGGAAPSASASAPTLYQSTVASQKEKLPSFLPQSLRGAVATVQTRLKGGLTKSRVEQGQVQKANERIASAGPLKSSNPTAISRPDPLEANARRSAIGDIRDGMPAEQAIQKHGLQNPTNQAAARQFEQGAISQNEALAGSRIKPGPNQEGAASPSTPAAAGSQQSPVAHGNAPSDRPSSSLGYNSAPPSPGTEAVHFALDSLNGPGYASGSSRSEG